MVVRSVREQVGLFVPEEEGELFGFVDLLRNWGIHTWIWREHSLKMISLEEEKGKRGLKIFWAPIDLDIHNFCCLVLALLGWNATLLANPA